MKALAALLLGHALLCQAQIDGGGRDVSVALFSAQPPHAVTVVAEGPGAWWAKCASCRHQAFPTVLRVPDLPEIFAGGLLTVRDPEHAQVRTANGRWRLRASGHGTVAVELTLPSERYVASVLMGETSSGEPMEYLHAMAVVARTFVLRPSAIHGKLRDICDSTACQAMKLGPVSRAASEAVRSTAGETLWFGAERAQVFFSGSCGGKTENAGAVWPSIAHLTYLRSMADPYCVRRDFSAWHAEVPLATLQAIANREGWRLPPHIVTATVAERTASQRATTIAFSGALVSAPSLRLAIGRSLGWNLVRSDAYQLHLRGDVLVFDGHGHGHGVGLCQQGAAELARAGKSYREILAFYFPGTIARVTRSDEGWQESTQDGLAFRATTALTPEVAKDALDAWNSAKRRFPPRRDFIPSITFAPTTEIFRQLTAQPGWQLASTSGKEIVLQPAAVFSANHASVLSTLNHEMLHVTVESSAGPNCPLWLREGLVEVLAREETPPTPSLSAKETDRWLRSLSDPQQSRAAHLAAAARVRLLMQHYGFSAVRGWVEQTPEMPLLIPEN